MDLFPASDAGRASSPLGEAGSATVVACANNDQCAFPTPICEPTGHVCVECAKSADCDSEDVCDTRSYRCVKACSASTACVAGMCDTTAGVCVECLTAGQSQSPTRCLFHKTRR